MSTLEVNFEWENMSDASMDSDDFENIEEFGVTESKRPSKIEQNYDGKEIKLADDNKQIDNFAKCIDQKLNGNQELDKINPVP